MKARLPLLGLFALSLYGWCIDFLAASWLVWAATVPAAFWAFRHVGWLKKISFGEDGRQYVDNVFMSVVEKAMAFLLGAVLMWVILVRTVGGGVTYLLGSNITARPVVLHVHFSRRRSGRLFRACPEQWRGDAFNQLGQTHICVNGAHEAVHPGYGAAYRGRQVEAELMGYQGIFGFYILKYNVLRDIEPYAPEQ